MINKSHNMILISQTYIHKYKFESNSLTYIYKYKFNLLTHTYECELNL